MADSGGFMIVLIAIFKRAHYRRFGGCELFGAGGFRVSTMFRRLSPSFSNEQPGFGRRQLQCLADDVLRDIDSDAALKNFEKARGGEDTQADTQISNADATPATTDAQKLLQ